MLKRCYVSGACTMRAAVKTDEDDEPDGEMVRGESWRDRPANGCTAVTKSG